MLLLEVEKEVLEQFLVFHEQVECVGQVLDLLVVALLGEVQPGLDCQDFLILVQNLLEDLQVVQPDLRKERFL